MRSRQRAAQRVVEEAFGNLVHELDSRHPRNTVASDAESESNCSYGSAPSDAGDKAIHLSVGEPPGEPDIAGAPGAPPRAFMVVTARSSHNDGARPGIYYGTPARDRRCGLVEVTTREDQTVTLTTTLPGAVTAALAVRAPLIYMGPRDCADAAVGEWLGEGLVPPP